MSHARVATTLILGPLWIALSACEPGGPAPERGEDRIDTELTEGVLDLDAQLYRYDSAPPSYLVAAAAAADNTPAGNPITDAGATLGRVLFWDTELSANRTVACASCHLPEAGFADSRSRSLGFEGGETGRKSMPLVNVRYYRPGAMFWDERAATLEEQVLRPIQDEVEMGLSLDELEARVAAGEHYAPLFTAAFGDAEVTSDRIARALAQFVRSITSFASPWDEGMARTGDPLAHFPNFTDEENRGKDIFFGRHEPGGGPLCNVCHLPGGPPGAGVQPDPGLFSAPGARVNGLPDAVDLGVFAVTGRAPDRGRFKSPSLRNVAARAPYMHDGRFATLEEVVAFYDHEVQAAPNLDPVLGGDGPPRRLNLSDADQAALVAFLHTLTDDGPALDPRFADPFVR
jgi:cytochrome c peroxidase